MYCITRSEVPLFKYLCELEGEIEDRKKLLDVEGCYIVKVSVDGAGIEHQEKKSHPAFTQLQKLRQDKRMLERDFSRRYSGPSASKSKMEEMVSQD